MSQATQQPSLENQIILLKAQLFDVNQAAQSLNGQVQELSGAVQEIINILGIPGTDGQVSIADVLERVRELAPVQSDAEVDAPKESE